MNRQGREVHGTVAAGTESLSLAKELAERLSAIRDPENNQPVISQVFLGNQIYTGAAASAAPDLVIGYNQHYRASWDTILGGFPEKHVLDNTDAWSGDHCVAPAFVPGVLLSNQKIRGQNVRLEDLAPTILRAFDVAVPAEMTGHDVA